MAHSTTHATESPRGVGVSLPVVEGAHRTLRNPRMGRRRAIVLALVQLAIVAHVLIWWLSGKYGWFGGATITPIEPSESMEFSKYGVINAGLIFFSLALLSTLLLGRWFCGWGCHVVLLQDGCLWVMRRLGIQPKPFRARLLMWAPLVLAVYMFIWPVFYRFVIAPFTRPDLTWPGFSIHLTTTQFWSSFPGLIVGIIFLSVCGFATVYFLGAKGFCTYGCPYGGFFAPLDKVARFRIRVSDACRGCAHCTAVCTSNVRVHEEVRTWGMVTDPGCMKTLDCINSCPTEALSYSFGPSAMKRASHQRMEPRPRNWDLSLTGEIVLALLCLVLFWAWRGLYASVPMLMAIGIAVVLTFLFWKGWHLIRLPNVNLHRWRLKFHGCLRLPGVIYASIALVLAVASAQALVITAATWNGYRLLAKVDMPVHLALDPSRPPATASEKRTADRALAAFTWAARIDRGGIGFADDPNSLLAMARLQLIQGETQPALGLVEAVIAQVDSSEQLERVHLLIEASQHTPEDVRAVIDATLLAHPNWIDYRLAAIDLAISGGRMSEARHWLKSGLELHPNGLGLLKRESVLLVQGGQLEAGIAMMRRYLDEASSDALGWATLAHTLATVDRLTEGDEAIERALRLGAGNRAVLMEAVTYYAQTGRQARARQLEARLSDR